MIKVFIRYDPPEAVAYMDCDMLLPEDVAQLLQLRDDRYAVIGALPDRWNHLVGYNAQRKDAALVPHTLGGPYFDEYRSCEYAKEWFAERDAMLRAASHVPA